MAPGGGTASEALVDPPLSPLEYQPRYNGVRPSWGLFVRYVQDLTVVSSALSVMVNDVPYHMNAPCKVCVFHYQMDVRFH